MTKFRMKDFGADTCGLPTKCKDSNGRRKGIKSYDTWRAMFTRCYSGMKQYDSYRGCSVSDEWKLYINFKKWHDENYIKGFHLDKDILVDGNKIYGADFCRYIPNRINLLTTTGSNVNRDLPNGVHKYGESFKVYISIENKDTYIGTYKTKELAFHAYKSAKESYVKGEAIRYFKGGDIQQDIYEALIRWSA